jgi:hypothetical protein
LLGPRFVTTFVVNFFGVRFFEPSFGPALDREERPGTLYPLDFGVVFPLGPFADVLIDSVVCISSPHTLQTMRSFGALKPIA